MTRQGDSIKLNRQQLGDLILALDRAIGWSDLRDNGKSMGHAWKKGEVRLLRSLKQIRHQLEQKIAGDAV